MLHGFGQERNTFIKLMVHTISTCDQCALEQKSSHEYWGSNNILALNFNTKIIFKKIQMYNVCKQCLTLILIYKYVHIHVYFNV